MKTKLHTTSLFPLLLFFFTLFSYAQTPPSGKALDFGGPTDYIALGNLGSVNNWTIETWFKPNGTTNYQNIFDSNDILNGGSEIRMELSSNWPLGRLYVYGTSGAYSIVPNGEILSDDWHHVVVISNQSAGKFIIYLDGIKKVDASPTAFATTFPNFVIGRGFSAGADRNYQGKIDEFRIWDKPLTEAEVLSNKNKCNLTGQENNLLAYYNFNQGVPNGSNLGTSTLNDLSPNNFNGTLYGFTLTGDSSNWIAEGICNVCPKNIVTNNDPNECGAIVNFPLASTGTPNAITSYAPASGSLFPIGETTVTATTTDSSGSSECTFTVTVTVNNTEAPIISCPINIIVNNTPGICGAKNVSLGIPTITNGCVTTGNALDFGGIGNGLKIPDFTDVLLENEQASISGWIYPRLQNPSFPPELDFIKDVFKVNTWQHLALSFDGTILKVYHNGILVGTIVPNISALIAANYDLATFTATIDFNQLLNDYFPLGLGGILDEVHVWNVARTQEQIQKEMNSEIEAQPGLIALYHFNEGIAGGNNAGVTTIKDDSGNGYDITLINFTLNGPTSNWVEGKSFNGVTFTNNAPTTYNTPIAYNYNNQLTANWTGTNTTIYPVGETIITWTAKDAAGNITTCTQTVTVELEQLVWSGAINTDWTNNGNWVNNVSPGLSPTSNISIPSGATNFPVITPSQTLILDSCYGITIATGAALTFNPNSVIINNSTVTNYGSLTFQSDITGSASIGAGIGTFVGDATIERYVSAKRAFRLLSSPVTTSTFISNNWQLGTHITGSLTNANGFDATGTGNPSMYSFDNISQSWNALPNTNATNLITGKPYQLLVRGDRTIDLGINDPTPTATTLVATGQLTAENSEPTPQVLNGNQGYFNLIGNPFQAQVNMQTVLNTTNSTNVNPNYYWAWDPTLGTRGAYVSINVRYGITSAGQANQYLQAGQAGFVQTNQTGPTHLTFTQSSKNVSNPQTQVFKSIDKKAASTGRLRLSLFENNALANNQTAADGLLILFDDAGNNDIDSEDAVKFTNLDENFATSNKGTLLGIESRATPNNLDEIPLEINTYRFSNYTIVAEGISLQGEVPYLLDSYKNVLTEIPLNGTVNYPFNVENDVPDSKAGNRFKIIYNAKRLSVEYKNLNEILLYPNPTNTGKFYLNIPQNMKDLEMTIYNALGAKILHKTNLKAGSEEAINTNVINSGLYFVKLTSEGKSITKKLIIN